MPAQAEGGSRAADRTARQSSKHLGAWPPTLAASGGQPLPDGAALGLSRRLGHDLSRIRIHTDAQAVNAASLLHARAFTLGTHIYFAPGQFQPGSPEGQQLLRHELTHVAQYQSGRIPHTGGLTLSQPGDSTEREAAAAEAGGLSAWRGGTRGFDGPGATRSPGGIPVVHRQAFGSSPAGVSNPAALIPIQDFIRYVEAVERAFPRDSPTDILTRIRVQYYSGLAFERLIPGAHTHDIIYVGHGNAAPVPRTLSSGSVDPTAMRHLTAQADENVVGDNPSPYIVMPDRSRIDVGHLLLGMDALIHPRTSSPYTSYGVPGIDPASWVADLGIASVWMTQHQESGSPPSGAPRRLSSPDLRAYYQMSAPLEDLLGDVDSFGAQRQLGSVPGQSLSQALRAYYLGVPGSAPGIERRWRTFCAMNGLRYTQSGTSITWDPGLRAPLIVRINRFNDLFSAGRVGALWGSLTGPSHRTWPHTPTVLDWFLDYVKVQLEAELAAHP